ncbi:hypothetical protein ILUMI_26259 [Ignelater luminosus]|uniref:Uncharacterized protein n=1 Tax=Ignelater luminosus TaxID=2038154 RepID=A0A8K0FVZ6_IGNLU|nr:hypothetical protein ILUMI_26259 [Ignelater luminosus]
MDPVSDDNTRDGQCIFNHMRVAHIGLHASGAQHQGYTWALLYRTHIQQQHLHNHKARPNSKSDSMCRLSLSATTTVEYACVLPPQTPSHVRPAKTLSFPSPAANDRDYCYYLQQVGNVLSLDAVVTALKYVAVLDMDSKCSLRISSPEINLDLNIALKFPSFSIGSISEYVGPESRWDPRVILNKIDKNLDKTTLIEVICKNNKDLVEACGGIDEFKRQVKEKFRLGGRDTDKYVSIVLDVTSEARKELLKRRIVLEFGHKSDTGKEVNEICESAEITGMTLKIVKEMTLNV